MTNHYARGEELLERAAEMDTTTKHTYAKSLAVMAQAHFAAAQTKAIREQTAAMRELCEALKSPRINSEIYNFPEAGKPALQAHLDILKPACACKTGARGDVCDEHDQPLPGVAL